MTPREIATRVAWHFVGKPYIWGGDDPMAGWDCSGLVVEILKSAGKLPNAGDWTAGGLSRMFPTASDPKEGCLVFYGTTPLAQPARTIVTHVEYCLDSTFAIGASAGGSKTLTVADAIAQNAFVKIRPIKKRSDVVGFVDPFVGE
jgi:hypothetical protein